jgi:hypothetical protein
LALQAGRLLYSHAALNETTLLSYPSRDITIRHAPSHNSQL